MKKNNKYDCIVIGGGHNGLVTAAYLAKQGKSVCVLERRNVLGGCATTEELWPGYKISTAAYVISLFQPEIIRELGLKAHGLNILRRSPSSFTPLLDGRSLTLGAGSRADRAEIAKFSKQDAQAYPRYEQLLERVSQVLEPVMNQTSPDLVSKSIRKAGLGKRLRDTNKMWDLYRVFGDLGEQQGEALELLTGAARPILERWFESEVLRATLATDAVIGAFASPSSAGTAYVLLHHVMGMAGGQRGVWGYVQGGMGGLASALEKACVSLGVEIRREAAVERIFVDNGKAKGVALADSTVLEAPVVASSVDAHLTFERFVEADSLPESFRKGIRRIDYSSASAKINLALAEAPQFSATDDPNNLHGTIHISPTLDYIERAFDDAKYGKPSTEPVLEITVPSTVDDTLAPEGKHVMNIFVQYAPYQLADGQQWDDIKEDFADRCIELLGRYAPNVPGAVEHRQILSPLDLERTFGLTGGNIMQGAMDFNQLFFQRPTLGWADHRSPIEGLYLCGAASHPGGGVMGICGKNAAAEIARDF